ncbi:MAG: hypothetical protein QXJ62_01140 [Nitrososphaeria archaeon]
MPYKVDIYIGSENSTRKIDKKYLEKIRSWANRIFPNGYTILKGKGFYNGISEDSLVISVLLEKDPVLDSEIAHLKKELKQESILLAKYFVELEVV